MLDLKTSQEIKPINYLNHIYLQVAIRCGNVYHSLLPFHALDCAC